jgi:hypothetical protein
MTNPEILTACLPFTMVSPARLASWIDDVDNVIGEGIPGHIVECGVYRGGCVFAAAFVAERHASDKDVYAYDTFTGMTPPDASDIDHTGTPAAARMHEPQVKCECAIHDFFENMKACEAPWRRILVLEGDIRDAAPPAAIAALRLDLDWAELTAHALDQFAAAIAPGGVLHIDDFGHWQGASRATIAWLARHPHLTASMIDYTGLRVVGF